MHYRIAASPLLPADKSNLLADVLKLPEYAGDKGQLKHLDLCYSQAPQSGHVLEFGVAGGKTVNLLAQMNPARRVWGFDTFTGLPEEWKWREDHAIPAGTFTQNGKLPIVPNNVSLVPGLIQNTLPHWLAHNPGEVAFVHIDVDIYSAAKAVLTMLNARIVPGTVIVFDDLGCWKEIANGGATDYKDWEQHEWRALLEWLNECNREIAVTSRLSQFVLGVRVLR